MQSNALRQVILPYKPPLNFEALLWIYEIHAMGNLEWFEKHTMNRVFEFDEQIHFVTISNDSEKSHLLVQTTCSTQEQLSFLKNKVRKIFDLDLDPADVYPALSVNSHLREIFAKHPGIRLPSGWDPFEVAIATILGQLVSVTQGRALVKSLIDLLGRDTGFKRNGEPIKLFPEAQDIATADLGRLRTTSVRKKTLQLFSQAVANEQVSFAEGQRIESFMKSVLAIPGIGPWTASYMALKCLRHRDAFPETDLILARALEIHPKHEINRASPWRGYMAALLWREYAQTLSRKREVRSHDA